MFDSNNITMIVMITCFISITGNNVSDEVLKKLYELSKSILKIVGNLYDIISKSVLSMGHAVFSYLDKI